MPRKESWNPNLRGLESWLKAWARTPRRKKTYAEVRAELDALRKTPKRGQASVRRKAAIEARQGDPSATAAVRKARSAKERAAQRKVRTSATAVRARAKAKEEAKKGDPSARASLKGSNRAIAGRERRSYRYGRVTKVATLPKTKAAAKAAYAKYKARGGKKTWREWYNK